MPIPDASAALRESVLSLPPKAREAFYASLTEADASALLWNWNFWARPDQRAPIDPDWFAWLALAGRGWGKTRVGAEKVVEWAKADPGCRIALIGRVPKDARRVMVEGESGILACSPPWFEPRWNKSLGVLTWPNGSVAFCFSSEVPDDLRGPQFHYAWVDEWAKFRFPTEVWDMLMFALRLGRKPRVVVTTTPRPLACLRALMRDDATRTTTGSTYANAENLPASFFARLRKKYEGTTLGRQELHAIMLDDAPGALWNRDLLEACRVKGGAAADGSPLTPALPRRATKDGKGTEPDVVKRVLAVDPSVSTDSDDADETGIVLDATCGDGHAYLLEDYSGPGGVHLHAPKIVGLWASGLVDLIVAEANNGGDLIEHTLRMTADPRTGKPSGASLPFKKVTASRGKRTRAEPVVMLYEQRRVHHLGHFAELEDQMCTWVPDSGMDSPDRMDAQVWAVTELLVDPVPEVRVRRFGR